MENVFEKFQSRAIDLDESKQVLGGADELCCECEGGSGQLVIDMDDPGYAFQVLGFMLNHCPEGTAATLVCNPY